MDTDRIDGGDDVLAPRVFLIKVARQVMKNNNYLIVDPASQQAVLVDPAWQIDKIHAALASTRSTLSGILLTHAHFDHIDLAQPLAEFYNCPIWMSRREIEASGFHARQLVAIDETPWWVGGMRIEPILTPGHTPGCMCYLIGNNLFTGDVLFIEGCGICNGPDAAFEMFESLELLKARLHPDTHVFPGHTYLRPPGQRFADVLGHNMYLHFPDRHAFAAFRLRKGQSESRLLDFR
ncbi:MBL fold metallo-hydrolase [Chitiniphilus purpureus]|uniref:MBL fold metallo-hydrolase n=1 Tax=Chitiniphilus purpureus TaxID=2981137 RepID=A0ABY6DPN2_9NEIS|nr:MBL fold metallo-hydrolase [Chitiniphilus sp. CD1]UXY16188.1 MBL fold metallo-hydrolase [Chitiniphilus sp. CD1]